MEYVLIVLFMLFTLWLGSRIMEKAGYSKYCTLFLLLPIVNIIMIWFFAFDKWPNLRSDVKQIT